MMVAQYAQMQEPEGAVYETRRDVAKNKQNGHDN
jgi:hypothetical protein